MKIKILALPNAPSHYEFSREVITAHSDEGTETYDLSTFPEGGVFNGTNVTKEFQDILNAERVNGELKVVLCQEVGPGHWSESGFFDAATYDPDAIYVEQDTSEEWAGQAWVKTRKGKVYPNEEVV